jgi:hypothetical protein
MKIERLLTANQCLDISKLMQSTVTPHLLLIACDDNRQLDEETKDVIRTGFDKLKEKQSIKLIFITQFEGSIVTFLYHKSRRHTENGFVSRVEGLTWSDLTTRSQNKTVRETRQISRR